VTFVTGGHVVKLYTRSCDGIFGSFGIVGLDDLIVGLRGWFDAPYVKTVFCGGVALAI